MSAPKIPDSSTVFSTRHIDLRTALYAMLDWIQCDMAGKVISSSDVIKWLICTPYLKYRNERLFLSAIAEHNKSIWAAEARNRLQDFSRGQIELNRQASGFDFDLSDTFGIGDFEK